MCGCVSVEARGGGGYTPESFLLHHKLDQPFFVGWIPFQLWTTLMLTTITRSPSLLSSPIITTTITTHPHPPSPYHHTPQSSQGQRSLALRTVSERPSNIMQTMSNGTSSFFGPPPQTILPRRTSFLGYSVSVTDDTVGFVVVVLHGNLT